VRVCGSDGRRAVVDGVAVAVPLVADGEEDPVALVVGREVVADDGLAASQPARTTAEARHTTAATGARGRMIVECRSA
jgi:hypothetical protein